MIYVGIDYSMTSPGLCVYNEDDGEFSFENCNFYYLASQKKLEGSFQNLEGEPYPEYEEDIQRFELLSAWLCDKLPSHPPTDVCIYLEGYSFGSKGSRIFQIAENTGILKCILRQKGYTVNTVPPPVIKKFASGKGNSNKEKMFDAFIEECPDMHDILHTTKKKKIGSPVSDLVDAYFICKYAYNQ